MKGSDIVDLVIVKLEEKSAFLAENGKGGPILSSGDNIDELKPVYSYINAHIEEAANEVLLSAPLNRLIPIDGTVLEKTFNAYNEDEGNYEYTFKWNLNSALSKVVGNKINLPPNFLRLYSLKMSTWDRPVHKAITKTDHLYTLQYNQFTRGTEKKPVVVYSGVRESNKPLLILGSQNTVVNDSTGEVDGSFIPYLEDIAFPLPLNVVDNKNDWYQIYTEEGSANNFLARKLAPSFLELYSASVMEVEEFLYIPLYDNSQDYNRDVAEAIALNCAKKVLEVYSMIDKAAAVEKELNIVLANMNL